MNKMLIAIFVLSGLFLVGCTTDKIAKEAPAEVKKEESIYSVVIQKSLKECQEHNISLDEKRITQFMHRSPRATIEKAANQKEKMPQKLCRFFAQETSDEKLEKVEEFTEKVVNGCKKVGVMLPNEKIYHKIQTLPLFVIKEGLALNSKPTTQECEMMKQKYE